MLSYTTLWSAMVWYGINHTVFSVSVRVCASPPLMLIGGPQPSIEDTSIVHRHLWYDIMMIRMRMNYIDFLVITLSCRLHHPIITAMHRNHTYIGIMMQTI